MNFFILKETDYIPPDIKMKDIENILLDTIERAERREFIELKGNTIEKIICNYYNITLQQFNSSSRKREIVQARQIAMLFYNKYTKLSLADIGTKIGNKDHATVLHACKTINNLIDTDKQIRADIDNIEKQVKKLYRNENKNKRNW